MSWPPKRENEYLILNIKEDKVLKTFYPFLCNYALKESIIKRNTQHKAVFKLRVGRLFKEGSNILDQLNTYLV